MIEGDLVGYLARFASALREAGVPVRLSDEVDAATALSVIDLGDRGELRRALLISLKIRRDDRPAFEVLFDEWWRLDARPGGPDRRRNRPSVQGRTTKRSDAAAVALGPEGGGDNGAGPDGGDEVGYSPEALLRRKPFDRWSEAELREMDRVIARLALRLATRRSRRLVPTPGRGVVDLRRSLRRTISSGGEMWSLARRFRPIERPRLVLLCDTSGSMDPYTRFLLTFVLSLGKVVRRAEVFAFNTALTRITPWLSRRTVHRTLERLATAVPDWSGGTRMGECMTEFVSRYLPSAVDGRTVVVILSDGLDRGDPELLGRAMRVIQRAARSVVWLNPLLGDARYEPTARGMAAALPYVDQFAPAHNLDSLEHIIPLLAA